MKKEIEKIDNISGWHVYIDREKYETVDAKEIKRIADKLNEAIDAINQLNTQNEKSPPRS